MFLNELRKAVAEAFENATDKTAIDQMAKINSAIEVADKEVKTLEEKNLELAKAYKDALLNKPTATEKAPEPTDVPTKEVPKFEDFLPKK